MSLPRARRVLRSAEFRRAYDGGARVTSRFFAAFCLRSESEASPSRFGFTVSRKVGKAVERNRLKRRMREALREHLDLLPANWTVVFNPRRSVLSASFDELRSEVKRVLARCSQS